MRLCGPRWVPGDPFQAGLLCIAPAVGPEARQAGLGVLRHGEDRCFQFEALGCRMLLFPTNPCFLVAASGSGRSRHSSIRAGCVREPAEDGAEEG